MKLLAILTTIIFISIFTTTSLFEEKYDNGQVKTQCNIDNGVINGSFNSWFENGQKNIEGKFENNQRVGTWEIWNKEGKLIMQREYKNSFEFDIIKPNISTTSIEKYDLKYNDKGFIDYSVIKKEDVLWSKQMWRIIEKTDLNANLFEQNRLFNLIVKNLIEMKTLSAYSKSKDLQNDFQDVLTIDEIKELIINSENNITGYLIKEESLINCEIYFIL